MAKKDEKRKVTIEGLYTSAEVRGDTLVIRLEDGLGKTETEVLIDFAGLESVEELAEALDRLQAEYPQEEYEAEDDQDDDES